MTQTQDNGAGTEYVVLRQSDNGNWREDSTVTARDGDTAIKKAYEAASKQPATPTSNPAVTVAFVAVPKRSWQPVKVTPKVETTLILEDVTA